MSTTRREFLHSVSVAGAALGVSGLGSPLLARAWGAPEPTRKLKVLILGGTGQTGPHLVEDLQRRGHEITLFNRGNRSEDLFPDIECLIGDRTFERGDGLRALEDEIEAGRRWDVCIDIWPHIPKIVEHTAELLRHSVGQYMYVSSLSVYADNSRPNMDESAEVLAAPNADDMEFAMALFGHFKAECENRVRRFFPRNHAIFRPGLIVGPRDFSFRGGYWPVRVRAGGEILAPGDGSDPVQLIDGRDLTAFQTRCMETGATGTYNVVGPDPRDPLTMRGLLETCKRATGSDARFVWADRAFLAEQQIGPWMNMPCWVPAEGDSAGFSQRNIDKALRAGLTFRPLADTVRDTLEWYDGLSDEGKAGLGRRAGIPPEREAQALAAFRARASD